jgi:hypothetical protein
MCSPNLSGKETAVPRKGLSPLKKDPPPPLPENTNSAGGLESFQRERPFLAVALTLFLFLLDISGSMRGKRPLEAAPVQASDQAATSLPDHSPGKSTPPRRIRDVAESLPGTSTEPRLRLAGSIAAEIDERESRSGETAEQIIRDLDRLLDQLQSTGVSLTGSGQVASRLADLAHSLRDMAKELARKTDALAKDQASLRKLYNGAPQALQGAAKTFTRWADEEPYGDLKDDYRSTARVLSELSEAFVHRRQAVPLDLIENSEELQRYLERCALFLDRYEQAMRLVSSASMAPPEEYIDKLTRFRDGFRALRQQFARYAETIKANY